MAMVNLLAWLLGVCTSVFIIVGFKRKRWETSRHAYPLLLASFPFYYGLFALIAVDVGVLLAEAIAALPFWVLAYAGFIFPQKLARLVGAGCVLHALYDYFHPLLFVNPGTPTGWVAFCSSIDVIVGVYLLLHWKSIGLTR